MSCSRRCRLYSANASVTAGLCSRRTCRGRAAGPLVEQTTISPSPARTHTRSGRSEWLCRRKPCPAFAQPLRHNPGEHGPGQLRARRFAAGELRFEHIAQAHEFVDFGDDAALFGEGREREANTLNVFL